MQRHVTLLGPEESPTVVRGLSSYLPPDLMEQVRGRVRLLALLLLVALAFDPLIYFAHAGDRDDRGGVWTEDRAREW